MGFQHLELMLVGHNWWAPERPPAGQHYERFYHGDGRGDEKTKLMWENAGDTKDAAQTWHSKLPTAWHNTSWTSDRFIEWVNHGRDEEAPFATWVSFPDPHHPFDCPEPWSRLHDPAEVDLPENRTRSYAGKPWWHKAALENEPGDKKFADLRKAYSRIPEQSDDQLREIIANTYGQIAYIDHEVGRMLIALEQAKIAENTIIIYISDHGDWLGDHGLVLKGPIHYEGLLFRHSIWGQPFWITDMQRPCKPNMVNHSGHFWKETPGGNLRSTNGACCQAVSALRWNCGL